MSATKQLVESDIDWYALRAVGKVGQQFEVHVSNPTSWGGDGDGGHVRKPIDPYKIKVIVTKPLKQDEEPDERDCLRFMGKYEGYIHSITVRVLESSSPLHLKGHQYMLYGVPGAFWSISVSHPRYPQDNNPDLRVGPDDGDPEVDFGNDAPGLYETDHGFDYMEGEFREDTELKPGKSYRLTFNTGDEDFIFLGKLDRSGDVTFFFLTAEEKVFYLGSNPMESSYDGHQSISVIGSYFDCWVGELEWPNAYERVDDLGYTIPPEFRNDTGGVVEPETSEEEDYDGEDEEEYYG